MYNQISAKKSFFSTSSLVKISILSVLSYLIMFIEIPVLFFPVFLKLDFSDIPAIIGGFALGPVAGVFIELIKNLLHFVTKSNTGGVGEFANFLVGGGFVFVSSGIYYINKNKKNAVIGCIVGTIAMAVIGGFANYYILIPFYAKIFPIEAVVQMGTVVNKSIIDVKTLIYYAIVPFNLLKGVIVSIITAILYKKVSIILK
ncbi:ECF transporter S component [Tepidibacter formicigenes]|uniref:Riboflavin transporter n=1 Tax=Tepidibacter formicigenes DSM 15518 TaxID=1123349 RepID=A0A1M6T7C0_9FIRM|nr:ECF transporter S component [Tepidibacter formicigenes]SHK52932.1 Riboflavin transporter FmnP [Tepidibacter formicigenes DSM 15518]